MGKSDQKNVNTIARANSWMCRSRIRIQHSISMSKSSHTCVFMGLYTSATWLSVCVLCLRLFCVHPSCHQSNGSLSVVRTRPVKRERPGPMSSRMRIKPSLLKSWTMFCNLGCGSSSFEAKSVGPSFRTSTTLLENILFCARFRDVVKKSGGPDVYLTSKYPTEA